MEIIPAIYLLDGKVVALYKGNTDQKETYYKSAVVFAQNFERAGAKKLYIADLNAKLCHELTRQSEIKVIINTVKIPIMLEAAFRNMEAIKAALDLGAAQVVLRSPTIEFAKSAIATFGPNKIVIQIFANRTELIEKREKLRSDDYTDIVDYAEKLVPLGAKYVVYKDQRAEGTLIHPSYDEIDRLFLTVGDKLKIYSSGGISEVSHLKLLKKIGAAGAIIGKALYERTITVEQAIAAVAD